MRAYIYRIEHEKEKIPGHEKEKIPGTVTPEYKTWEGMYKYYIKKYFAAGKYTVELYYNWENRYKQPDRIIQIEIGG